MPKIELMQGDCLEKMKDIPDKFFDCHGIIETVKKQKIERLKGLEALPIEMKNSFELVE